MREMPIKFTNILLVQCCCMNTYAWFNAIHLPHETMENTLATNEERKNISHKHIFLGKKCNNLASFSHHCCFDRERICISVIPRYKVRVTFSNLGS